MNLSRIEAKQDQAFANAKRFENPKGKQWRRFRYWHRQGWYWQDVMMKELAR